MNYMRRWGAMSTIMPVYNDILRFIEILVESLRVVGYRAKVASIAGRDVIESLRIPVGIEEASSIEQADIVLEDVRSLDKVPINFVVEKLGSSSLSIILNVIACINQRPELSKELGLAGLTKSLLPIDGGAILSTKRGYDVEFFKKTVEVYRESFIHGPNPIDYNTAAALYILAKFLTTRRKGTIIEVGTGRGFSTLWLAHAAKETGSHVISIDNRCDRVDYARNALKALDLEKYAEVVCIDAKSYVHGGRDIVYVFIDGKKDEYHKYLEALEPYLQPGALILAHNTLSDAHLIKPYIEKVYREPFRSITIATDPKGLTISVYTP